MSQIILKHLEALAATMQLGLAQIEAMRHALTETTKPTIREAPVVLPDRCNGVDPSLCTKQGAEWKHVGSFGDPHLARCAGCRIEAQVGFTQ